MVRLFAIEMKVRFFQYTLPLHVKHISKPEVFMVVNAILPDFDYATAYQL